MIAFAEKRIVRLMRLVRIMEGGNRYNSIELSEMCGVGRRTIFRDIKVLRECGYKVEFDQETNAFAITTNSEGQNPLTHENKIWLILAALTSPFHGDERSSEKIKAAISNLSSSFQDQSEVADLARSALEGLLSRKTMPASKLTTFG